MKREKIEKLLKSGRIQIDCDTEEKAEALFAYLQSLDITWASGAKLSKYETRWKYNTTDTRYLIEESIGTLLLTYGDVENEMYDYDAGEKTILTYEEFFKKDEIDVLFEKLDGILKKIIDSTFDGGWNSDELTDIFGEDRIRSVINLGAAEIIKRYEAWEKKEKEIKLGDVFMSSNEKDTFIVTLITPVLNTKAYCVMLNNGDIRTYPEKQIRSYKKIGNKASLLDDFLTF